jgi:hypothetical protein
MRFFLKRYGVALRAHKQWGLLVLLSLVLYLMFMAYDDVNYSVSQDFVSYSVDIPVAASNSPIDTMRLSQLVDNPDLLFLDGFAMMQLARKLGLVEDYRGLTNEPEVRSVVHVSMALSPVDTTTLRLRYSGKDERLGRILVDFYTERLMKRIADGWARTKGASTPSTFVFQPAGPIVMIEARSIWSTDRWLPAGVVLLLSTLGVLGLIAVFEITDPSFKSERQMARYLDLPVLGTLPDADPLAGNLRPQGRG